MRILALDLSTHTGWALFEEDVLKEYGLLEMDRLPESYKDHPYPINYVLAAERHSARLYDLVGRHQPDIIVIEETVPGRETYSQKLLEFLHCKIGRASRRDRV